MILPAMPYANVYHYEKTVTVYQNKTDQLPIVDISLDESRQTVIAEGTKDLYQGHPTTALGKDGKTIFCVWCINHGGPCGPAAVSYTRGNTWTRIDHLLPPEYAKSHANCPTLQVLESENPYARRFCIFSRKKNKLGIVASDDDGKTWYEIPEADLSAAMPPTGCIKLKNGSYALFGQVRTDPKVQTDGPKDDQDVWMATTNDLGTTWSKPTIVAHKLNKNLCEPFALRSPDGNEICLLMRENRHEGHSYMCFSQDEGKTWSEPRETSWGLSGDRHEAILFKDGRCLVAFRDRAPNSSTYGQFVAWLGTYDDIKNARPGLCRIHLLKHHGKGGWSPCDTGYPGVELLDDGSIICTTYTKHWDDERKSSVVCTKFRLEEIDGFLMAAGIKRTNP